MQNSTLTGNSLDDIADFDWFIKLCKPYLDMSIAKYLEHWLHGLYEGCECKHGFDHCKYLDYHPEDGSVTCKQTAAPVCRAYGYVFGHVFETVPKDEDKDCLEVYELFKKLSDSCPI